MGIQARRVVFCVPLGKAEDAENFLRKCCENKRIAGFVDVTNTNIYAVSAEGENEEFEAKRFGVIVIGDDRVAKLFISSLFEAELIPEGKIWTVYGPMDISVNF